jgi:4-hydroxybenzoate polyprenyltransferase
MILFRIAIFLLLLAAGVYFAYYIYTGQQRYKTSGLKILKWTIVAALGFFGVLILERLLQG